MQVALHFPHIGIAKKTLENSGFFDYIYINKIDTRAGLP